MSGARKDGAGSTDAPSKALRMAEAAAEVGEDLGIEAPRTGDASPGPYGRAGSAFDEDNVPMPRTSDDRAEVAEIEAEYADYKGLPVPRAETDRLSPHPEQYLDDWLRANLKLCSVYDLPGLVIVQFSGEMPCLPRAGHCASDDKTSTEQNARYVAHLGPRVEIPDDRRESGGSRSSEPAEPVGAGANSADSSSTAHDLAPEHVDRIRAVSFGWEMRDCNPAGHNFENKLFELLVEVRTEERETCIQIAKDTHVVGVEIANRIRQFAPKGGM
jgi:hypothetical protein